MIRSCPDTIGKRVSLYIDNQSVFASLSSRKAVSGQHLTNHLLLLANQLTCRLSVHWISSRSKVQGNEKADELAKEAASGLSSTRDSLPHILRSPIPDSASARKQAYHDKLMEKWEEMWEVSRRSQRISNIDDNFPFNSYRKRAYMLTRNQSSLMNQIRSGHFPLNGYLFKIDKSDTEFCPSCQGIDGVVQRRETIKHFLFECRAYQRERTELANKIGRGNLNLHDIMENTDYMRALAGYISKTGWLKKE